MKRIASIALALGLVVGGGGIATAASTPVSEKSEAGWYTVNPGRCIMVIPQFGQYYYICNYTAKLPRTYYVDFGSTVWYL